MCTGGMVSENQGRCSVSPLRTRPLPCRSLTRSWSPPDHRPLYWDTLVWGQSSSLAGHPNHYHTLLYLWWAFWWPCPRMPSSLSGPVHYATGTRTSSIPSLATLVPHCNRLYQDYPLLKVRTPYSPSLTAFPNMPTSSPSWSTGHFTLDPELIWIYRHWVSFLSVPSGDSPHYVTTTRNRK